MNSILTLNLILSDGKSVQDLLTQSIFFHSKISPIEFWIGFLLLVFLSILIVVLLLIDRIKQVSTFLLKEKSKLNVNLWKNSLKKMNSSQIARIIKQKSRQELKSWLLAFFLFGIPVFPLESLAQTVSIDGTSESIWSKAGIIITLVLLLIPTIFILVLLFVRINRRLSKLNINAQKDEAKVIVQELENRPLAEVEKELLAFQEAADYRLKPDVLSGSKKAVDPKGLLSINENHGIPIVSKKKRSTDRTNFDVDLSKMVNWYLISATAWLVFGTTIGEYLGFKFVAPDMESFSWLSFGRLRPVHTNAVFWGWASLAMIGLGYYVVPRVSNTKLYSLKLGWYSLILINVCVFVGTISLMAGINNSGGEYREYIWPIMLLFGIALVLTLINYYKTIAKRTTREIYISNWYIVAAVIFTIVISLAAYLPFWQNGLGETIIQGYYMHQGVGMWFMLFCLGLVYYFLPQQLNRPIYSYSLGILAFWTQILFYTLIGSHHFVFSSIPWWLQTVAIVGSAGMAIPVIAGTTNFLMTFKGSWYKLGDSYILPFFLVGIIFYFTGSMQGTAEAFRETNLIWHFTDFTVAHSHLTMYGIISFFLWASIYTIVPRFTGREAPQISIGAHFWFAFIGMLMYTVPLMYGSTMKGIMWLDGKPFIDGVTFMAPYWLWRAIGGSLMWLSHLIFAYNLYKMMADVKELDIAEEITSQFENQSTIKVQK